MPGESNFQISPNCYQCMNNGNRLNQNGFPEIKCGLYEVDKRLVSYTWVCDDYQSLGDRLALINQLPPDQAS